MVVRTFREPSSKNIGEGGGFEFKAVNPGRTESLGKKANELGTQVLKYTSTRVSRKSIRKSEGC